MRLALASPVSLSCTACPQVINSRKGENPEEEVEGGAPGRWLNGPLGSVPFVLPLSNKVLG